MDFEIGQKKFFNISINISSIGKKSKKITFNEVNETFFYIFYLCIF